jgi:hypothetical protein
MSSEVVEGWTWQAEINGLVHDQWPFIGVLRTRGEINILVLNEPFAQVWGNEPFLDMAALPSMR